jgi:CRP-like cAMP-binding protein
VAKPGPRTAPPKKIRLLEADRDLGAALNERQGTPRPPIAASVWRLDRGEWSPDRAAPEKGHFGFLVLSGLIARRLKITRGMTLELLSDGDLLRPWQEDADSFDESRWRVLERAELVELNPPVAREICRHPALVDALLEKLMRRCRYLSACAAIQSITGLEDRLVALFWHLAERSGSRGPEGVVVPLHLTHQALAEMVGARRPSVTAALRRLEDDGRLVRPAPHGWLLSGDPPGAPEEPPGSLSTVGGS